MKQVLRNILPVLLVLPVLLLKPACSLASEITPIAILKLLDAESYTELNNLITRQQDDFEAGKRNELEILHTLGSFHSSNEGLKKKLNKWVNSKPDSYPAYLARGAYFTHIASLHRGEKYASDTRNSQLNSMQHYHGLARSDFNTALTFNNKLMYAYSMLIRIGTSSGSRKEVRELADRALAIDPASYLVHRRIMFWLQPKWGGSATALSKWLELKIKPYEKENYLLKALYGYPEFIIADSLRIRNKHDQAKPHYNNAAIASEGKYNVLFLTERGTQFYYREEYDRAISDLDKALGQYPYYSEALEYRGRTLNALKRYDEALRDLDLAISLDEYNPDLRRSRAYVYRNMKKTQLAFRDSEASLIYGSNIASNWKNKGYIQLNDTHDYSGAAISYQKATIIDINDEMAWYNLGIAQYKSLSCDFVGSLKNYLKLCKKTKCEKTLVDWSKTNIKTAIDQGYCK